jgi:MFS family permease
MSMPIFVSILGTTTPEENMRTFAGLWQRPDFWKLWTAQSLAALTSHVSTLAISLLAALSLKASPFEMGLLSTMGTLPNVMIGLVAGAIVDRVRRRPIMIAADACRALLLISLPVAATLDLMTLWHVYAVLFLCGVCSTFFDVAHVSYVPSLVGKEQVINANSRLVASSSVAGAAGPGIAGGLIQVLTAPVAILVDACSLAVSAALVFAIRTSEVRPAPREQGLWGEVKEGLQFLHAHLLLRSITVSSMIYLFFSGIMLPIYVLYTTKELDVSPGEIGLIFGIGGLGAFLGAFVAMPGAHRIGVGPAMIMANSIGGLFMLLVPLAGSMVTVAVPLLMAAQFWSQLMGAVFFIIQTTVRQLHTPGHLQGRLNASYRFLTMGILPVGSFLGGVLGEIIGLSATIAIASVGTLLPACWLAVSEVRTIRALEEHAPARS